MNNIEERYSCKVLTYYILLKMRGKKDGWKTDPKYRIYQTPLKNPNTTTTKN